jgi:hypothetical protein
MPSSTSAEEGVVEGVEADRYSRQTGVRERTRLAREDRAVRGERDVERAAFGRRKTRKALDQEFDVLAQERLAARQPDFLDAMRDENPRDPLNFLERQQSRVRQELVVLVEDFARHAVDAAEIATICHRNAQIAQRTVKRIGQEPRRRRRDAGEIRNRADIGYGNDASGHGCSIEDCALFF